MSITKPVLKWVGGKTQIIDDVLGTFPQTMVNYHEPFVGGGSVLLALLSKKRAGQIQVTGTVFASDLNPHLIALYKVIQAKPAEFIAEMKKLIAEFAAVSGTTVNRKPTTLEEAKTSPESYYYWIRSVYNKARISPTRASPLVAAMLVFLNKTCFRGVYREGPNGFNVPYGNNKNPGIMDEAHVKEVSELFQGVVFTEAGFADSLAVATSGDFVYMDPPYAPENATSFVGYTADGFDMEQHKLLFQLATGLKAKGVGMSMSNAQVSLVTNAFPAPTYTTKILSARRAINSKKPESRTNEVLITLASHGSESQSESQSETHGS